MIFVFYIFDSSECLYGLFNEYLWNFYMYVLSYYLGRFLLLIFDSFFIDILLIVYKMFKFERIFFVLINIWFV